MDNYDTPFVSVAEASAPARAQFYRRTYAHVIGAFVAWMAAEAFLFASGLALPIAKLMLTGGALGWLAVIGVFWLATAFGQKLAFSRGNTGAQYAGLGVFVAAYAVLFVPLIVSVCAFAGGGMIDRDAIALAFETVLLPAVASTALLIVALTATVFMTRTDFSFLRTFVVIGSFVALGAIVVFAIFGINPGAIFAALMCVLMAAAILWETHQVKNTCDTTQHVGAAAVLFASFMTLLWYVIQLFMSRRE
ncbi:MAG: Bax inhibitor-1 family protein [Puniceicoccales bacterium]|jgi:FtsH-binding integral membrane protein|nr:Bax inhibitor-1 family protein [Puniceicoccales bacterium]